MKNKTEKTLLPTIYTQSARRHFIISCFFFSKDIGAKKKKYIYRIHASTTVFEENSGPTLWFASPLWDLFHQVCVFNAYYFTGWGDRRGQLVCQCCDTTLTCGGLWALRVRDWPVRWKAEVCESTCAGKRLSMLRCVLQEVKGSAVAKRGYFHSFLAISLTFSFLWCAWPQVSCSLRQKYRCVLAQFSYHVPTAALRVYVNSLELWRLKCLSDMADLCVLVVHLSLSLWQHPVFATSTHPPPICAQLKNYQMALFF